MNEAFRRKPVVDGLSPTAELRGRGAQPEAVEEVVGTRVIALLANPDVRLNPAEIAKQIGASEREVRLVLADPKWVERLKEHCSTYLLGVVSKGIQRMEGILAAAETKDATAVQAFRAVVAAYGEISKTIERHDAGAAEENVLRLLDRMKRPESKAIEIQQKHDQALESERDPRAR